jgi:hypothetical protein
MVQERNPDAVPLRPAVPSVRPFRIHAEKLVNCLRRFLAIGGETASCKTTYPFSSQKAKSSALEGGSPVISGGSSDAAGEPQIYSLDAHGADVPTVLSENPALELMQRRFLLVDELHCLAKPDAETAESVLSLTQSQDSLLL